MKKLIFLLIAFSSVVANAQSKVYLNLEKSELKEVSGYKFIEGEYKSLPHYLPGNLITMDFPKDYTGVVYLNVGQGLLPLLVESGYDVNINYESMSNFSVLNKSPKGDAFEKSRKGNILSKTSAQLKELKTFEGLSDKFRKSIGDEIMLMDNSVNTIQNEVSKPAFSDVSNYYKLKEGIGSPTAQFTTDYLTSELLKMGGWAQNTDVIIAVANYIIMRANKTGSNAKDGYKAAIDEALEKLDIESPLGQSFLNAAIAGLKRYKQDDLVTEYLNYISEKNCQVISSLDGQISRINNNKVGATLQDFEFKGLPGNSIKKLKSDYKLMLFFASWCSHCHEEMPNVLDFYNTTDRKKIDIVGISADRDKNEFENYVKDLPWKNYFGPDFSEDPYYFFNVDSTPTFMLVDKNNTIVGIFNRIDKVKLYLDTH